MKSGFKILDSDMHLREPADLWDKYMEPEFRDQAPKVLSSTARSSAMVLLDGKILRGYQPTYRGGIFDATRIDGEIAEARARKFDSVSQLQAMDREGLDVAALYPSIGLGIMMREDMDSKLAAAIARAYNNWLYDFCQADPKRLKGVAMLPLHDPAEAVKEAQRAVVKLGFVGVFARPEPLHGLPWHSRYFDTLWSVLEELGVPLGFHWRRPQVSCRKLAIASAIICCCAMWCLIRWKTCWRWRISSAAAYATGTPSSKWHFWNVIAVGFRFSCIAWIMRWKKDGFRPPAS